ncbi:hypothetical protein FRX31_022612 [Thalictrum thalictroides]|uniref:Uncharacterized protein n=1 Tax=Thalictrum thalictroides TaxID=46969 RepID=A0A7J6VRS8_THATH|nr:hypothetical protein FRX31_022612 [Thalictrum thalictroides]
MRSLFGNGRISKTLSKKSIVTVYCFRRGLVSRGMCYAGERRVKGKSGQTEIGIFVVGGCWMASSQGSCSWLPSSQASSSWIPSSQASCPSGSTESDEDSDDEWVKFEMELAHNHNVIYMQVFDSIERSMCPNHFEKFTKFHENVFEFCNSLSLGEVSVKDAVLGFFLNYPARVRRLDWVKFGDWLKSGEGVKFGDRCEGWSEYARNRIKVCEGCRNASMRLINFDKVIVLDEK